MERNEKINDLLRKHIAQTLSVEEKRELFALMESTDDREHWAATLAALSEEGRDKEVSMPGSAVWQSMLQNILAVETKTAPRVHQFKKGWFRYAAAVLVLLGMGLYIWISHKSHNKPALQPYQIVDIPAGGNKATLTLSDGSVIVLDSAANGTLVRQGASDVIKRANGALEYIQQNIIAEKPLFNTITTPKGGQFQLTLPDGTKVWLNAASSIEYPVAFSGKERKVTITGEAYFDVTKNAHQPFQVQINNETLIHVLGTQFNVNSYTNETGIKTTLVEGSIKIIQKAFYQKKIVSDLTLLPGQQAVIAYADQRLKMMDNADVQKVLAWKNGSFNFQDMHFPEVARQLERWYDIEVVYENKVPAIQFKGDMDRGVNLSDILRLFEAWGIKAKVEGRKLLIQ